MRVIRRKEVSTAAVTDGAGPEGGEAHLHWRDRGELTQRRLQSRCFSSESPNSVQSGKKRDELDGPWLLGPLSEVTGMLLGLGAVALSGTVLRLTEG